MSSIIDYEYSYWFGRKRYAKIPKVNIGVNGKQKFFFGKKLQIWFVWFRKGNWDEICQKKIWFG